MISDAGTVVKKLEPMSRGRTDLRLFSREFDELVKRKLADPEWKYLRTD